MKLHKVLLLFMAAAVLCVPYVTAGEKSSYKTSIEAQDVALDGKIFFSDYYSMGGEKCAAFLEAEDGSLFCILDNMKTNDLKGEMGLPAGRVKVTGNMVEDEYGRYLKVEDYEVKDKKGVREGPGAEEGGM